MRYFYDTEFIEDGRTIDLVSIGIVSEDGREYYAVNRNVHWERVANPQFSWIRANVWPHLPTTGPGQLPISKYHPDVKDKVQIAEEILKFVRLDPKADEAPEIELWADYCAYDHVALCQLWGRMVDLPSGMPFRTNDIMQLAQSLGVKESAFPKQKPDTIHHALYDARHNREVFSCLVYPQRVIAGVDPFSQMEPVQRSETNIGTWGKAPAN